MREQISIITGKDAPNLTSDGKHLGSELRKKGYSVEPVFWTDEDVDWNRFEAAILRSCWGYYKRPHVFRRLIRSIERSDATLLNRPDVVRWNLQKSYLRDLQNAGIEIISTEVIDDIDGTQLADVLERRGWEEAVVKPIIGTSAAGVWKTTKETARADQKQLEAGFRAERRVGDSAPAVRGNEQLSERGALIQQFVPEVGDSELSLVFLGGEYSHAWKSIRVPKELGVEPEFEENKPEYSPTPSAIEFGSEVLEALGGLFDLELSNVPYARVDCVERGEELRLMELELIEPYLNLGRCNGAVENFASAIVSALETPLSEPPN